MLFRVLYIHPLAIEAKAAGLNFWKLLLTATALFIFICALWSAVAFFIGYASRINMTSDAQREGNQSIDYIFMRIADTASASLRSTDLVGRFGGEEFAAILPNSDLEDAIQVAERVRAAFETAATEVGGHPVRATVSIGAALGGEEALSIEALLTRADEALYQAKRNGRNRVEAARGDTTTVPPEVAAPETTGIPTQVPATALVNS